MGPLRQGFGGQGAWAVLLWAGVFFHPSGAAPNALDRLLEENRSRFAEVLVHPDRYGVQILYTQIDRDRANQPTFTTFAYRVSRRRFFHPASLVKLTVAALALEKLNDLGIRGVGQATRMTTEAGGPCQTSVDRDGTSETGFPSVGHYVERMLLTSDNEAYNRLYEFLGQRHVHDRLGELGYPDVRIVDRFDSRCDGTANRRTNPVFFSSATGEVLHRQAAAQSAIVYPHPLGRVSWGTAYVGPRGRVVRKPKDFTRSNFFPLEDAHAMLQRVLFPESVSESERFRFHPDDYTLLLRNLSRYPREAPYLPPGRKAPPDSVKKYLIYGGAVERIDNDRLRVFNVVGRSYGFVSETAFIVDLDRKIEFFLSAVIYVNRDGILNDGKYEYETVGLPFFAELGKVVYEFEAERKKDVVPDLSTFDLR